MAIQTHNLTEADYEVDEEEEEEEDWEPKQRVPIQPQPQPQPRPVTITKRTNNNNDYVAFMAKARAHTGIVVVYRLVNGEWDVIQEIQCPIDGHNDLLEKIGETGYFRFDLCSMNGVPVGDPYLVRVSGTVTPKKVEAPAPPIQSLPQNNDQSAIILKGIESLGESIVKMFQAQAQAQAQQSTPPPQNAGLPPEIATIVNQFSDLKKSLEENGIKQQINELAKAVQSMQVAQMNPAMAPNMNMQFQQALHTQTERIERLAEAQNEKIDRLTTEQSNYGMDLFRESQKTLMTFLIRQVEDKEVSKNRSVLDTLREAREIKELMDDGKEEASSGPLAKLAENIPQTAMTLLGSFAQLSKERQEGRLREEALRLEQQKEMAKLQGAIQDKDAFSKLQTLQQQQEELHRAELQKRDRYLHRQQAVIRQLSAKREEGKGEPQPESTVVPFPQTLAEAETISQEIIEKAGIKEESEMARAEMPFILKQIIPEELMPSAEKLYEVLYPLAGKNIDQISDAESEVVVRAMLAVPKTKEFDLAATLRDAEKGDADNMSALSLHAFPKALDPDVIEWIRDGYLETLGQGDYEGYEEEEEGEEDEEEGDDTLYDEDQRSKVAKL